MENTICMHTGYTIEEFLPWEQVSHIYWLFNWCLIAYLIKLLNRSSNYYIDWTADVLSGKIVTISNCKKKMVGQNSFKQVENHFDPVHRSTSQA